MKPTPRAIAELSLCHVPDADLLRRFADGDHAAFELVVRRYWRLVLGVCRRVTGNPHDAEDAAQAAFLVLARRATVVRGEHAGGWLARVAYRCAVRVRKTRRHAHSDDLSAVPAPEQQPDSELAAVLDAELNRLPDKYRVPVVLCYLDGKTYHQAAAELNCPVGTLCGWLTRGRAMLRARLARRGVTVSAAALAAHLGGASAGADAAIRSITEAVAIRASGGVPPGRAAAVADGVIRMMSWKSKLPLAAALLALAVGLTAAVGRTVPQPPAEPKPAAPAAKGIRGVVVDANKEPVAGAAVVAAGVDESGEPLATTTDAKGRFAFDQFPAGQNPQYATTLVAAKDGFAPASGFAVPGTDNELTLTLPNAATYSGTVKDRAGKPVAGAEVQFGTVSRNGNFTSWGYTPVRALRGTPVEKAYIVKTDATGAFKFRTVPAGGDLIFRVNAPGFAERDSGDTVHKREYLVGPNARPANLVLDPEAVVRGRITSKVPGVKPGGLTVRMTGAGRPALGRVVRADENGRFVFRGLPAGEASLNVDLPEGTPATARGVLAPTKAGETSEVTLEVIEGVVVTGTVRVKGTDKPVPNARVAVADLIRPKTAEVIGANTDANGRFALRVPPGEGRFYVQSAPGFSSPGGNGRDTRAVTVPEGAKALAIPEPFEVVEVRDALAGRVTDATGKPLAHVKVSALQHSSVCGNFATEPVAASFDGQFELKYSPNGPLEPGRSVPLRVETSDGRRFEAAALVGKAGVAEVRVPTIEGVAGPQDVKPSEFAGLVVDEKGKPLAGVKVHIWDWVDRPENITVTGADGVFRFKDCGSDRQVQVRYTKDGHSPVLVVRQQVGVKGLVVAMDRATYFEGVVAGPDGKPAGGAVVRADCGPKMMDGGVMTHCWMEAKADAEGRYRLYVPPDEYEFHVKARGVGVARLPKAGIAHGQGQKFDIRLQPGITFKARVVDSVSGKPAAGVRLFDWQQKDVEGKSDAAGEIAIGDMLPGEFTFQVESAAHARWWAEQSPRPWERKTVDDPKTGWQRNFDGLTFDLKPGMAAVTIHVEPAVKVTGRVLDPNGKPVAGATVAPARTGSGNSLTGDTRFSVATKADGTFEMALPASGAAEYNLVAHDGKYGEWRTWANGVLPPIKTKPGQVIEDVTLKLTRPAVVRGRVVDAKGQPVAGREVRAHAADRLENRYYDPTTATKADGTFELKFVRPAEQFVQVAPFWLSGAEAPVDSSKTLKLKEGQVVENVTLTAAEERPK